MERVEIKSELQKLLEKNASPGESLTKEEEKRAYQLIANPVLSEDDCLVCKMMPGRAGKAIFDTGLCGGHALYALAAKK